MRVTPSTLLKLGATGAVVGTGCDALHNQAILAYDAFPVQLELWPGASVATSLLVPPLLAFAYAVIGQGLPAVPRALGVRGGVPLARGLSPRARALLAMLCTACVIRASEALTTAGVPPASATLLLAAFALGEWLVLDGSLVSLMVASVVGLGGPLAELPFLFAHAWHYLEPNVFPLRALSGLGSSAGALLPAGLVASLESVLPAIADGSPRWDGLDVLCGPCYFAVATDSIALAAWFRGQDEPAFLDGSERVRSGE
jgi:hypothetical protein